MRSALSRYVRVYGYELRQPDPFLFVPLQPLPGVTLGDTHTSELGYVFGMNAAGRARPCTV